LERVCLDCRELQDDGMTGILQILRESPGDGNRCCGTTVGQNKCYRTPVEM